MGTSVSGTLPTDWRSVRNPIGGIEMHHCRLRVPTDAGDAKGLSANEAHVSISSTCAAIDGCVVGPFAPIDGARGENG